MKDFEFIQQLEQEVIKNSRKSKFHKGQVYENGFDDGVATVMEQVKKILNDNSLVIVDRATVADMEWLQEQTVDLGDG